MTPTRMFIVGLDCAESEHAWDVVGVFSTEALANAAATTDRHFIFPAGVDYRLPDGAVGYAKPFPQPIVPQP